MLLSGVLLAGAACSTSGTPTAEPSGSAPPSSASSAPATSAAPAPPTDEQQVRETVQAFQDAYNTQNWDAYLELMCQPMREKFSGSAMELLKKTRAGQGLTKATVTNVTIHADSATATIDAENEVLGRRSVQLILARDDGWKVCMNY